MNTYRLFVLMAWMPDLGAYVDPVGVLGVEHDDGQTYVSWVPLTHEIGRPWHRRLVPTVCAERIEGWLEMGLMAEASVPDLPVPMAESVEGLLDQLLVGVIPALQTGSR